MVTTPKDHIVNGTLTPRHRTPGAILSYFSAGLVVLGIGLLVIGQLHGLIVAPSEYSGGMFMFVLWLGCLLPLLTILGYLRAMRAKRWGLAVFAGLGTALLGFISTVLALVGTACQDGDNCSIVYDRSPPVDQTAQALILGGMLCFLALVAVGLLVMTIWAGVQADN